VPDIWQVVLLPFDPGGTLEVYRTATHFRNIVCASSVYHYATKPGVSNPIAPNGLAMLKLAPCPFYFMEANVGAEGR